MSAFDDALRRRLGIIQAIGTDATERTNAMAARRQEAAQSSPVGQFASSVVSPGGDLSSMSPQQRLISFGKRLQQMGYRVSENPAFGGVEPVHVKNSRHYSGNAIDVNYGRGGTSREETAKINAILKLAQQYGLHTIWQAPGHYNHAHFDVR